MKVVSFELVENDPLESFWWAWTHGLLSIKTQGLSLDWTMYGLKCFIEVAIQRASSSYGNQSIWRFLSFALKNPGRRGLLLSWVMQRVAFKPYGLWRHHRLQSKVGHRGKVGEWFLGQPTLVLLYRSSKGVCCPKLFCHLRSGQQQILPVTIAGWNIWV